LLNDADVEIAKVVERLLKEVESASDAPTGVNAAATRR
jgi:hypothetical protein